VYYEPFMFKRKVFFCQMWICLFNAIKELKENAE